MKTALIAAALSALAMLTGIALADHWHSSAVADLVKHTKDEAEQACRVERLQAVSVAESAVREQAKRDIDAAQASGQAREVVRTRVETKYITLRKEAARAPSDPVDRCELPVERLQRWQAANAAPASDTDQGAATGQPGAGAAPAAGAGLRPYARPGAQPSGRDRGVPPGVEPAVRPDRRRAGSGAQGLRALDAPGLRD